MLNLYTFIYFPIWCGCIFLHYILSVKTYNLGFAIKLDKQPPLYDIIQRNFPNLQRYRFIPEILHLIPVLALVGCIIYWFDYNSLRALNKFFITHGPLMALRGIFFSVTLLPDSSQMCFESNHLGSCFDLIFSGHSTIMLLCSFIINEFFNIGIFVYIFLMFKNFVTFLLIILCRNHYTIDVLISIFMTYFVYSLVSNLNF